MDVTAIGIASGVTAGLVGAVFGVKDQSMTYLGGVVGMCAAIALSAGEGRRSYWVIARESPVRASPRASREWRHARLVVATSVLCVVVAFASVLAGVPAIAGAVLVAVQAAMIVWCNRSRKQARATNRRFAGAHERDHSG